MSHSAPPPETYHLYSSNGQVTKQGSTSEFYKGTYSILLPGGTQSANSRPGTQSGARILEKEL